MLIEDLVTGTFWVTTTSSGVYVAKSRKSPPPLMLYKKCGHISTKKTLVLPCECKEEK